jgi:hypothetical protein
MSSRRQFILTAVPAALAVSASTRAVAQPAKADESEPLAVAVGFRTDASRVDTAKFPKYVKGQSCSGCMLYQGKAGDASGPCLYFGGKLVNPNGWCSSFVKKA